MKVVASCSDLFGFSAKVFWQSLMFAISIPNNMEKYFSIRTFITVTIVLVLFYILAYWLGGKRETEAAKPSEGTLKTKSDCEKYGYIWDEEKQLCKKSN